MKLMIVLLAVLAGVWLWRRGRTGGARAPKRRAQARAQALPMVRCARCGIHVPADEVVAGRRGSYCCAGHRQDAEDA
ncbi:MAG: hypothetical protein LBE78_01760 [Burkholderiaceae bacterium]|jgi:uncharacterized protein|nr:hypothetical protein [Burkholderiaceae bacterium]